ncbi:MAG: galactokinase [Armatimonadota bacterium]
MIDAKELEKALQGGGDLTGSIEEFLAESYSPGADMRYQRTRYLAALCRFMEAFPDAKRVSIARAPGRVNLIGEHIDYNGLPVLPMAIERDVVVIFAPRKDRRINLVNVSCYFPPRSFDISTKIRPYAPGNWGNYPKAATQALQEVSSRPLKGFDACLMGDVPSGSGLSSSSAMVVATAITLAAANSMVIERKDLAELLARGERYVGTEGGGMDQAASLLSERKKALKIDFFPLSSDSVPMPDGYSIVVCNSLVAAEKSGAARDEYNRRVVECRLGVAILGNLLKDRLGPERNLTFLGGLKHLSKEEMLAAIDQLPDGGLTIKDAAKLAGIPAARLKDGALKLRNGEYFKEPKDGFRVKQRVRHVLTEGRRVEDAVRTLKAGDIDRFGELMNQSHESCAKDYEISTPELDTLVSICRDNGALGARLTGAGFGGCVIALVNDSGVPDFVSTVVERYYHDYLPKERNDVGVSVMALEDAVFPCKPCSGAATLV